MAELYSRLGTLVNMTSSLKKGPLMIRARKLMSRPPDEVHFSGVRSL
jgi:hypothetical protein